MFILGRKTAPKKKVIEKAMAAPLSRGEKIRFQKEIEYQNKILRENYQMIKLSKINKEASEGIKEGLRLLDNELCHLEKYDYYGSREEIFKDINDLIDNARAFADILVECNCVSAVIDSDDEDFGTPKSDDDYLRDYNLAHPEVPLDYFDNVEDPTGYEADYNDIFDEEEDF